MYQKICLTISAFSVTCVAINTSLIMLRTYGVLWRRIREIKSVK